MIPVLLLGVLIGAPIGWITCALVATAKEANHSKPMEHPEGTIFRSRFWSEHIHKGE